MAQDTRGERIKKRRLEMQMTQVELAKRARLNKTTVYRYERDYIDASATSLLAIARVLELSVEFILTGQGGSPRQRRARRVAEQRAS